MKHLNPEVQKISNEMEVNVTACNRHLRDRVKSMSLVTLLRNTHPADRNHFASRLRRLGVKTLEEFSKETF